MAKDPPIFAAAGREFSFTNVLEAAVFRGELEPIRRDLQDALSCQTFAEEEGFEIDEELLQAASDDFRVQCNLVTAEATAQWLLELGLTVADFSEFLERRYWRQRFNDRVADLRLDYHPAEERLEAFLWPELVLSGQLVGLALPLAARVAVALEGGGAALSEETRQEAEAAFFKNRRVEPEELDAWLSSAKCTRDWYEELLDLEGRFLEAAARHLTEERCTTELMARRMDLTRVEILTAKFHSVESAREAVLSAVEDREDFSSICRRAGVDPGRIVAFIDGFPEDLRPAVFCAAPGQTLPPDRRDEDYYVYHIVQKLEPELNCPEVVERIQRPLLDSMMGELVEKHISWKIPIG